MAFPNDQLALTGSETLQVNNPQPPYKTSTVTTRRFLEFGLADVGEGAGMFAAGNDPRFNFVVNAKDPTFAGGAKGDGVTNDANAIAAALSALANLGGGELFFPQGTYVHSGVTSTHDNVTLRGMGMTSIIAYNGAIGDGVVITGNNVGARSLRFNPTVTKTAGYELTFGSGEPLGAVHTNAVTLEDVFFGVFPTGVAPGTSNTIPSGSNVYGCLHFNGVNRGSVNNIRGYGYKLALAVDNSIDVMFTNFLSDSHRPDGQGVVFNSGESCTFRACDWVCSWTGGQTNPCFVAAGGSFNDLTDCFLDTSTIGFLQTGGNSWSLNNVWSPSTAGAGISIQGGVGTRAIGGRGDATFTHGIEILAGGGHLVQGREFTANGQGGNSYAVRIGASCTGARVLGCAVGGFYPVRLGSGGYLGAMLIENGATNIIVTDNDFAYAGGINNQAAGEPTNFVSNNLGGLVGRLGGIAWEDGFSDIPGTLLSAHTPTRVRDDAPLAGRSYVTPAFSGALTIENTKSVFVSTSPVEVASSLDVPSPVKIVQFDLRVLSNDVNGSMGVTWNAASNADTCYSLRYASNGAATQSIQLFRFNAGTATQLGAVNQTLPAGTYTFRCVITPGATPSFLCSVQLTGSSPQVLFGGAVTDATPLTGTNRVGIRADGVSTGTTGYHLSRLSIGY